MSTRWFITLSVILAILDQVSKQIARMLVDPATLKSLLSEEASAVKNEIIPNLYSLTLTFNPGIAWGMLPQWSEYFTYFAIIMVLVILMIMRKLDRDEVWLKIALAFQMAGAFGNMADRLIFKKVTDFVDVVLFPGADVHYNWQLFGHSFRFDLPYDWPIFNLADSFVVVGTSVLVLVLFFAREPETAKAGIAHTGIAGQLVNLRSDEAVVKMPGSLPEDEGLKEIPPEETSELLVPFEDADSIITEVLGTDDYSPPIAEPGTGEPGKLGELDKRPQKLD